MNCLGLTRAAIAKNRCNYAIFVIGTFLLLLGIAAFFFLEASLRAFVADMFALKRDSVTFKLWMHPPADVYMEIYLMNITNPERAALGLEKPNLVNQGPYVFYEVRRKLNATFHGNGTLSFYEPVFYFWNQERSGKNKLSDKITQLDLVVAGMSHQFSHCTGKNSTAGCINPFLTKTVLPSVGLFDVAHELFTVQKRSIFKTYTVNDFLFNGFVDPFLVKFKKLAKIAGQNVPSRVGLFYGRNGSANGVYTVDTGEKDIRNYQMVTHFNGKASQDVWTTPYANKIYGTVGHAYRPFIKEGEPINVFAGDICRSGELYYTGKVEVNGVMTFLYKPALGGKSFPEDENQRGFCYPDINNCPPQGLMDETPCVKEPTFMGKPHFFDSDPLLGSVFTGLNPNIDEHETEIRVDPYTGSVMDVDKRLMIYFPVRKSFITEAGNIHLTPNHRDGITTIFPMFWVNETATVRKMVFDQIRYMVYPAFALANVTPYIILATGLSLVIIATIRFVNWKKEIGKGKDLPKTAAVNPNEDGYRSKVSVKNCHPGDVLDPLLSPKSPPYENSDNNKMNGNGT